MSQTVGYRKKKKFKVRVNIYHFYYKKKGVYSFLFKNMAKIAIGLLALIAILYFVKGLIPDFDNSLDQLINRFDTLPVLSIFLLSESILGLIPPDLFIVWSQKFDYPYAMISLLALLSYLGGLISYYIGKRLGSLPRINSWIKKKFIVHFDKIQKWGGVLIIFAALFPLPFSPVCMVAGMVRFPIPAFLSLALFRFARFFAYALVLFKVF